MAESETSEAADAGKIGKIYNEQAMALARAEHRTKRQTIERLIAIEYAVLVAEGRIVE